MKKLFALLACFWSLIGTSPEFTFVVPSYNNEKYARRNLESLITQNTDRNYSIIVVNDCSTDGTANILEQVKQEWHLDDSFLRIIHNKKRIGALANIYTTIHRYCADDTIVAILDGDDFLAHKNVIQKLEKVYASGDIWLTYGSFVFYPEGSWGTTYEISADDFAHKRIRELPYVAQHLRTFKAGLFKKIKKKHLMKDGNFFAMNADMATMIPMLEMAGAEHSLFIPEILVIYNFDNPLNDHKVDRSCQLDLEDIIRAFKPYEPLKYLEGTA